MKRTIKIAQGTVLAVILFATIFVISPTAAQARSAVAVEGASFNVSGSVNDNLKMYARKDVVIHLRSGKTFQGYVKSIGNHFIHLEKLADKDFYDALIRVEDISAIEAKFRDMK